MKRRMKPVGLCGMTGMTPDDGVQMGENDLHRKAGPGARGPGAGETPALLVRPIEGARRTVGI